MADLQQTKIYECIKYCFAIMCALAYDNNPTAPTITVKENIIKCVVALYTKDLLNWKQKK